MRAHRKFLNLAASAEEVLSQANAMNYDGNVWCGRTSASIIHNYYRRVYGGGGPIKNQVDKKPYDLVYPTNDVAAAGFVLGEPIKKLVDEGMFKSTFTETYDGKGLAWDWKPLYTPEDEKSGKSIEESLGKLLDNLDNNNPLLFASCISELKGTVASHFVVISGYEFDAEGELWLQITCPSASYGSLWTILGGVASSSWPAKTALGEKDCLDSVRVEWRANYLSAPKGGTLEPAKAGHGCRYTVKVKALLQPHPGLVKPSSKLNLKLMADPGARRYICDNYSYPGFSVLMPNADVRTEATHAVTDLAISWPIDVGGAPARGAAAKKVTSGKEETASVAQWESWVDTRAPYPVGSGLTWHNGIHLNPGSAANGKIFSIGPGELILARFAKEKADAAGAFTRDPTEAPSSGFVLVRHRFDPQLRTIADLPPRDKPPKSGTVEMFCVYMHLAPISTFLDAYDAQPEVRVAAAACPRWLRPLLPEKLPPYRGYFPEPTPVTHSVAASIDDAKAGRFTPLPGDKSPLGQERAFTPSPLQVDHLDTAKLTVGSAPHVALPGHPTPMPDQLALLATHEVGPLGFYNPLTHQMIEVDTAEVPACAAISTRHGTSGEEVDVLHAAGNDRWVRTACFARPGLLKSDVPEGSHVQPGILCISTGSVKIGAEMADKVVAERSISNGDTRLVFPCKTEGKTRFHPELWPLLRISRATLADWEAPLAMGSAPAATLAELCFFNPLTESVIDGLVAPDPTKRVVAEIGKEGGKAHLLVVLERGDDVFVKAKGVAARIEAPAGAGKVEPTNVLFFDQRVSSVKLYLDTFETIACKPQSREFIPGPAMLAHDLDDEAVLAFRLLETQTTGSKTKVARYWPDLAPCVKVPASTVDDWNARLAARAIYAEKADARLKQGSTQIFGVELGENGWGLDGSGRVVRSGEASGTTIQLGSVHKESKAYKIVPSTADVAPHYWAVGAGSVTILPLGLLVGREGLAHAAFFEVAESVPDGAQVDNRPDIEAAKAENKKRWDSVTGSYAQGSLLSFKDAPITLSRESVGAFDRKGPRDGGVHMEIFSKDTFFPGNEGEDEKLVRIAKTPWQLLRDDDCLDAFTPDFIERLRKALRAAKLSVALDERELATADREHQVIKPSEWSRFCAANQEALSFIVSAHTSEWHPDHAKILDEANNRGAHLAKEVVARHRDEIERLAFLDQVYPSNERLFFYHPLRLLEWMMTGVDLYVDGVKNPRAKMKVAAVDLVPDQPPNTLRYRTTVGSALASLVDYVELGEGFQTNHPNIPVSIVRGEVTRLKVVNPHLECHLEDKSRFLLADGGKELHGTRSTCAVEGLVRFNVTGPEKITATLVGSGSTLGEVSASPGGEVVKTASSVTVTWKNPAVVKHFGTPEAVGVTIQLIAADAVDQKAHLDFTASGGDLSGTAKVKSPDCQTRTFVKGESGDDVMRLQKYLAHIPANDETCYPHGGDHPAPLDGIYGKALAAALWRFLYTYAADVVDPLKIETVAYVDDGKKPGAGSVTLAQLQRADDGAIVARCSPTKCNQYPKVDGKLLREIVKRFEHPHLPPHLEFTVDERPWSGQGAEAGMSLATRSAILPAGDSLTLRVHASGLEGLKKPLPLEIELPGGSAYSIAPADRKKTLTASTSTFTVRLESSGKISAKPTDNLLSVRTDSGVLLGALQLAGTCDRIAKAKRDGVPHRDALILQHWLRSVTVPAKGSTAAAGAATLDGTWGEPERLSLARFAAGAKATSYIDAVTALKRAVPPPDTLCTS